MEQLFLSVDVSREAQDRLRLFAEMVRKEASSQNLVSDRTLGEFENRHVSDSVQLVPLLAAGPVVDIGSGAGLPGVVLAILSSLPFLLVEPRRRRADFLSRCADALGLEDRITVLCHKVERLDGVVAGTITARAVASLDRLFGIAGHLAGPHTRWVLPKGRSAEIELEGARRTWQGEFRLVPSRTDPDAAIVVAERVRRRGP